MVVFYSLYKLKKEQARNIRKLEYMSELKYLELADLLPQVVFETDYDGLITFLNNNGKEVFGVTRIDIHNGLNIKELVEKSYQEKFYEDFLYIREGGLNRGQEYLVRAKNGRLISMMFFMSPIQEQEQIKGLRGIAIDITEQKKLERKILSAVIETEDKERQRFAEDLHDGLGPLLSTIKLYVDQMNNTNMKPEDKNNLLKSTYELLDESIKTTRAIANNILPGTISDNGLVAAVNSFCHKVQSTGAVNINFESNLQVRLDSNLEKTLYRIIIELINNTIKHANATNIDLDIEMNEGNLTVFYSDNGIGFNMNQKSGGMGMDNIKNRCKSINAEYKFSTAPGKGFKMVISLELKTLKTI